MTACVNRKHSRRVAAVISASLVGALSLGVAPVAAMANDGIDMLEATDQSSINDGAIASFKDGLKDGHVFVADGKGHALVPEKIQPWGTTAESAQVDANEYTLVKLADKDSGTLNTDSTDPTIKNFRINGETFYYESYEANGVADEIGEYAVFAFNQANNAHVYAGATFSIVAADLDDAELYEYDAADPDDLSDTEFVFDNTDWKVDGTKLAVKIGDTSISSTDYDVQYYDASDKQLPAGTYPKAAGEYSVVLTGKGNFAGQKVTLPLTVDAFDLSTASVVVPDVVKEASGVNQADLTQVTINGLNFQTTSWMKYLIDVEWTNLPTSTGKATVTFRADDETLAAKDLDGSVINSISVDYSVVEQEVQVKATYGTADLDGQTLNTDFSANPTNAFDASKVSVAYVDPKTGKDVESDAYNLRVTDEDGNVGGTEMLSNPGKYTVEVVLDAEALDYKYCNDNTPKMTVNVTKGTIAVTDIAFAYKGEIVTVDELKTGIEYIPGANVLDDISVSVKTANGEVSADDYEIVATKNVDGKDVEVDSVEGAGTYKVSVVADGYTIVDDENFINVVVAKRDISAKGVSIRVKGTFDYTVYEEDSTGKLVPVEKHVLPYTGEEVVPTFEWGIDVDGDGETDWFELPASDYEAKYSVTTSPANNNYVKLVKADQYDADIFVDSESENYTGTAYNAPVEISDIKVYADVPTTYWGAQAIYEAGALGLMTGYNDGSLFGPEDPNTRAQMAIVLYRLAGKPYASDNEGAYSENEGWKTGFDDVDGNMYYSEAIAWAHAAGIVNGYDENTFGPEDPITREQFAVMLANFAKACGDYVAPEDVDAVLSAYDDGDAVADWAADSVAWAVEAGLMGQDVESIWAGDAITRAQVAAMAVRYVDAFGAETIF